MTDIKKGTEAKQGVEGFAKKGKVKAFVCGTAKMLEEKVKNIDPVYAQVVIGGVLAVGGETDSLSSLIGAVMFVEPMISTICNKPPLIERLANLSKEDMKNAPKNISNNVNNFANKVMEKGGR